MASLTKLYASTPSMGHLRPFDARHDLNPLADLIELCFADTLDRDGYSYLKQMRSAAHFSASLGWLLTIPAHPNLPLSGYVWEEQGQLVGNLTLIPYYTLGRRYYLIANVAVHPNHRRQGIASRLTKKAIEHAQQHGAHSLWLQVREDNQAAIRLYRSLGFSEKARRTTWVWELIPNAAAHPASPPTGIQIGRRRKEDWLSQRAWLRQAYPPEVDWYLSLKIAALGPGLWGALYRLWHSMTVDHWCARQNHHLLGVVTWQSVPSYADILWLATKPEYEEQVVQALLPFVCKRFTPHRSLLLDYPAGRAFQAFQAAGFQPRQTLIWMSLNL